MTRRFRRNPVSRAAIAAAVVLGIAFFGGLALVAIGVALGGDDGDVWFEVAKVGIQLAGVAVLGGLVAFVLRYLDSEREAARKRAQVRLGILRELVEAYNQVKGVRRTLRAFGIASESGSVLTSQQTTEFISQMRILNTAQLSLESIKRQIDSNLGEFRCRHELKLLLDPAESYVNHVVDDWEEGGLEVESDGSGRLGVAPNLRDFLGGVTRGFKAGISRPVEQAQRVISEEVTGGVVTPEAVVETIRAAKAVVVAQREKLRVRAASQDGDRASDYRADD